MTYRDILSSDFFFDTYSQIEFMKSGFPVNHGFLHVWHVIKNAKYLSELFELDSHEKELLLIACAVHDIGYLDGRDDHAINGEKRAREYLNGKLEEEDIERVCQAIANHGGHEDGDYVDKVSRALVMADKLDFVRTRYREDPNHKSVATFLTIHKVELLKRNGGFDLEVQTTSEDLTSSLEDSYFFNKLKLVLERLSRASGKNVEISIVKIEG